MMKILLTIICLLGLWSTQAQSQDINYACGQRAYSEFYNRAYHVNGNKAFSEFYNRAYYADGNKAYRVKIFCEK